MTTTAQIGHVWQGKWIGSTIPETDHVSRVHEANLEGRGAPWLRQIFTYRKLPEKVFLYISAPGWFCAYLNGKRVGDRVLSPVITQFNAHVAYVCHDVTAYLQEGDNAMAVLLGNGWYNCQSPMSGQMEHSPWRNQPSALIQLETESGQILLHSDQTWRAAASHIVMNALRAGETQDTRQMKEGVSLPNYDDSSFGYAEIMNPPPGELISEDCEPCRIMERLKPVSCVFLGGGSCLYDFGTSVTGWCEITTEGPSGATIVLQHGEKLTKDGLLDISEASVFVGGDIFQKDTYILNGRGPQCLHPHFCYHGFRYVQVQCSGGAVVSSLEACFIHTDFDILGHFSTETNPVLNRLQEITRRSYLCNYTGIPTDCPHREKNGWTGDQNLAYETGCYNFNIHRGMENFCRMLMAEQRPSGQLPCIAPTGIWGYNWGAGPAWDAFIFEAAEKTLLFTGKDTILRQHYDGMKKYLEYCRKWHDVDGLVDFGLGDWAHFTPERMPSRKMTSTAFYYDNARRFSVMASYLGRQEDAKEYHQLAEIIRRAFVAHYVTPDGDCENNSLTALATPLFFNMLDDCPDVKNNMLRHLLAILDQEEYKANVGILGAKFVGRVLGEMSRYDDMVRFFTQPECPGWGNWVRRGATSLWERWDGRDSHIHVMFGDVSACVFRYIAGIRPLKPGFSSFLLNPAVACISVPSFKCTFRTPHGTIASQMSGDDGYRTYECEVPEGTEARLSLFGRETIPLAPGHYSFPLGRS